MNDEILILKGDEIASLLKGREIDVIELVQKAYIAHAKGETALPHSTFLRFPGNDKSRIIALPAYLGDGFDVAGIKWIASFPENYNNGMDRASASVILNSTSTGRPEAILEGSIISAKRTAAGVALAARTFLGDEPLGVLGLIGCGLINYETARFIKSARPGVDRLCVFDLDKKRAAQFTEKCAGDFEHIETAKDLKTVLRKSRVIALATTSVQPHISDLSMCSPGSVILHTSLRDLQPEVILSHDNVVDDLDHVCRAQTSIHLAEQMSGHRRFVRCSLGDILLGQASVRTDAERITIFSPFGLGILDIALAKLVCELGAKSRVGTVIDSFLPSSWLARP